MIVHGYEIKPWANLRGANLHGADLRGASLSGADLRGADLSGADLRGADLSRANPREADLSGAILHDANLSGADLRWASLSRADLRGADLRLADLREADLMEANLRGADFRGADLREADLRGAKNIPPLPWTIVPSEGNIIVYKKLLEGICTLLIPKEAKRLNATSRKCRAEFAMVLNLPDGVTIGHSIHDDTFVYEVGKTVAPKEPFCEDRWDECSSGIHFFITREEAENY